VGKLTIGKFIEKEVTPILPNNKKKSNYFSYI
jgi:hypothetical protein